MYLVCVFSNNSTFCFNVLQHLYVYGVLVFEAMATFVGQVSVLSLIALFGAATTAMVSAYSICLSKYLLHQQDLK